MSIFIGAENIISPLGQSASSNFEAITAGRTAVKAHKNAGFNGDTLYLGLFDQKQDFHALLQQCFEELAIDEKIKKSPKTKVIISSTKGTVGDKVADSLVGVLERFKDDNQLPNTPLLMSNACVTGVLAIIKGADLIKAGLYDHVIVLGCDLMSDFVVYGFESLFALSDDICKPFDKNRKGINIGEACAGVVLSKEQAIFKESVFRYLGGSSSNDANHISGPSRTGEGLYRSIQKTLNESQVAVNEVDFITAHGTATLYNDNMESIAFHRAGLDGVYLNSLKGYFGHTLGAAGVVELAIAMQSMRTQQLVKSLGYQEVGTDHALNVITENKPAKIDTILKTSSGFGGVNATLIIQK